MENGGGFIAMVRKYQKERNRRRSERIMKIVEAKIADLGTRFTIIRFAPNHLRFNQCLEIYPEFKKFHVICKHGMWKIPYGEYDDITRFVETFFNDHKTL